VGPRPRQPDRLPRQLRARRGGRSGGVRDRRRALAARGDTGEPQGVAGDHRSQPGDRPDPARPHAGREDAPARCAGAGEDEMDETTIPDERLELLFTCCHPALALDGQVALHASHARRPDHRRDRPSIPRPERDDGQAAGPREAQDRGRRDPVPRPSPPPASRPARRGAGGDLSDLQRGLRRARGPRRGGDPHRPGAGGADAG